MCQLTKFEASNEETESKIEIYVKKLSKIGFFEKFDFWSNVNAKAKVNSQHSTKVNGRVKVNSDQSMVYIVWVDFEFFELGHGLGCRAGDVVLMTWH